MALVLQPSLRLSRFAKQSSSHKLLQGQTSLREIRWSCFKAKHSSLRALFAMSLLQSIDVSQSRLGDDEVVVIADVLANSHSVLTKLSLLHNSVGVIGCRALAGVLHKVMSLTCCLLMWCQ